MIENKKIIIYTTNILSTFVRRDLEILKSEFNVVVDHIEWTKKNNILFNFFRQLFFYIRHGKNTHASIVMFAGYWSVIPTLTAKIFGFKTYIILGGTDCVSFPEFKYGSLRKFWLKKMIGFSINNAHKLLPVAKELICQNYTYDNLFYKQQGLKVFFPSLTTEIIEIPNGYPSTDNDEVRKEPSTFLTVATLNDETRFYLKGIDLILNVAKKNPNISFTIAGTSLHIKNKYFKNCKNVTCIGTSSYDDLVSLYKTHQFYLQLSISEGHPNTLCEAMSYGCIPIVSDVSSMPRIVQNNGYILKHRDVNELNEIILKSTKRSSEELIALGKKNKERIKSEYSLDLRRSNFIKVINSI